MSAIRERLARAIYAFPAESRLLGAGRTLIALAQASVLLFTPAAYLFVPVGGEEVAVDCAGLPEQLSVYCLADDSQRQLVTWCLLGMLLVVASGLLPRFTSLLHLWVSLSIHNSISLPDGGEAVAMVATLFLVLACANDRRVWHWQRPRVRASASILQGVAWAGLWGLRLQMAYVYLNSAVAKLSVAPWQEGTATYYVARMENFGAAGLFADLVIWSTGTALLAVATTWGSILAEATLAVFLVRRNVLQVCALAISVALHVSIMIQLGIVSFALIMIGAVLCATSRGVATVADRLLTNRRAARIRDSRVTRDRDPHEDSLIAVTPRSGSDERGLTEVGL
ncbi:hypothetical protein OOJ91_24480 [Micromonospora lupini]|uniref:sporulation-delaying protein SdpB family protein n=1 Tax=Micromonospora lupini TaxID=285679 RepID=UPI002257E05F|nr:sporulation-delaying protein SdpB family protein [Micromonospora lupini]MCX5069005.1 hypothetical protein [Micromonospora lupini]